MRKYDYINIRLGTNNTRRFSHGNILPLTAVPYGTATFTIQNEKSGEPWFYSPHSKSFEGIRLTHQPSPWMGDYGQLIITGQRGELLLGEDARWASFDSEHITLEPAYMKGYVYRDRYTFELTPTMSGAVVRFTFADGLNRINLIGDEHTEFYSDGDWVLGYTTASHNKIPCGELREYFAAKLNVPYGVEIRERAISLVLKTDNVAELKFAASFVSQEQAKENYRRELEKRSFADVRADAERAWEQRLSCIEIEDADEQKKAVFYTSLYRVFLWPRRFYEIGADGVKRHIDLHSGQIADGVMYSDNGFWDTFRTVYPLLSLVDTDLYAEMCEGFYNYYRESGWLPKWLSPANVCCMPGMLIEAVMADAIVKEIVQGELAEKIFVALLHDGEEASDESGYGRTSAKEYRKFGYIPYTAAKESVNETLDCCYGDYCIAQAAAKLGHKEIAERYYGYAKNYRNLFDKQTGFMRGKDEHGNFREEFDCYRWGGDYTEGSAWQSSFAVYHDLEGLNELYDGKLADKIDDLMAAPNYFTIGSYSGEIHEMSEMADEGSQCAISNQPSFHIPYIYAELGDVAKTAKYVEKFASWFTDTFDGYPGDEDNGTMAAWYVLSCLGLYQMSPSRPDFTTSVPLFDKLTVRLSNGKTLTATRKLFDTKTMKNRVSYTDLMSGGELAELANKERKKSK